MLYLTYLNNKNNTRGARSLDPGNPTVSGVSECNNRIMSISLVGKHQVTPFAVRETKKLTLGNTVIHGVNLNSGWGNASEVLDNYLY